MTDDELNELSDVWIARHEAADGDSIKEETWWAVETVFDLSDNYDGEELWKFILNSYKKEMSDKAFGGLAAGPLEDLLAKNGKAFIERVETLARQDQSFNRLLGGVWKNSMTADVWKRVQSVRNEVW